jgi:PAS domain S-box-containing protein
MMIAGYYLLPSISPGPAWAVRLLADWGVAFAALGAIAVGIRSNRPGSSRPWWFLFGSHACFCVGDVLFYTYHYLRADFSFPAPSDIFYLGQYPLLVAALLVFVRRRSPSRSRAGLIDALIIGSGAALLSWVFLMSPYVGQRGPGLLQVGTSLAYPLMDIVVLAVALRLLTSGASRAPSFVLLVTSIITLLATDAVYGWAQLHGAYTPGGFTDGGWMISYLCLGAAALHPSMRTLTEPSSRPSRDFGRLRFALLAGAALLAPAMLLFLEAGHADVVEIGADTAAALLLFLVIARLAEAMRIQQLVIETNQRVERELLERDSELRREQEFLQATLDSSHDAIVATDADGNVTLFRGARSGLVGEVEEGDDLAGVHSKIALYRLDGTTRLLAEETPLACALRGDRVRDLEAVVLEADGTTRSVLASGQPISVNGRMSGAVVAFHDITERKQLEGLASARAEAERANQAKSEFLSRVSHELRTPLNAILGFGQLLELGDDLSARDRKNVGQIVSSGKHLLSLIDEILDVSRIDSGMTSLEITDVELAPEVGIVLDMLAPLAADRDLTVRTEVSSGLRVSADVTRLREVLVNLLSNAIKYNTEGGSVFVSAEVVGVRVHVRVSDTGVGIASHLLPRLFRPFDRLGAEQSPVEGTGLGLTVTKALLQAMGAAISVVSEPGAGSTFTVDLPRVVSKTRITSDTDARRRRVLCIEDNAANLALIRRVFEMRPEIDLLTAASGTVGLNIARSQNPELVLLDLNLPDISGQEVLTQLRNHGPTRKTPVVVVSADTSPETVVRLRTAGAAEFVPKPIDIERLLALIDESVCA